MKKIYFLCTGNSCRSQMAEGYGKILLKGKYEVRSAGIEMHGLNPYAVKAMAEDLSKADLVVTLCGDARDRCPALSPQTKSLHWPLIDPAQVQGTPEQKMVVFRQVRDEIKKRVANLK